MTDGGDAEAVVTAGGLGQISDREALASLVRDAIAANPKAVADVKAGKERAKGALVGYVMKQTRGRANAALAEEMIMDAIKDV
jgi:aspartyl-tRNA(Asn)/glutamyl-tRNA(Gln) amidotransferase subunit B